MQNLDIWNFHSSLALNNGKLVRYFKSLWYAIVSNMTHFYILFGMRGKMPLFELCVTLNNGKLFYLILEYNIQALSIEMTGRKA